MSSLFAKMMKAVKKHFNLIVKLPSGEYVDRSVMYYQVMYELNSSSNHSEEILEQYCNITEYCFKRKWLNTIQHDKIFDLLLELHYSNDSFDSDGYEDYIANHY